MKQKIHHKAWGEDAQPLSSSPNLSQEDNNKREQLIITSTFFTYKNRSSKKEIPKLLHLPALHPSRATLASDGHPLHRAPEVVGRLGLWPSLGGFLVGKSRIQTMVGPGWVNQVPPKNTPENLIPQFLTWKSWRQSLRTIEFGKIFTLSHQSKPLVFTEGVQRTRK